MKTYSILALAALLVSLAVTTVSAASNPAEMATAKTSRFVGKLQALDADKNTITVANMSAAHPNVRTFVVTTSTAITEGGKAAALNSAHVSEKVTGTYTTEGDRMVLVSLHINVKGKTK